MKPKNRDVNIFSMSALDLFASGMGAFILLAVISLPFFANTSRVTPTPAPPPPEPAKVCPKIPVPEKPKVCPKLPAPVKPSIAKLPHTDLVIVLDISGSMRDTLEGLKRDIGGIADLTQKMSESTYIRLVVFGDQDFDRPVTGFSLQNVADIDKIRATLDGVKIDLGKGSGRNNTSGESVYGGYKEALRTPWRSQSTARIIVLLTDDVAHPGERPLLLRDATNFAAKNSGNRTSVVVTGSGSVSRMASEYKEVTKKGRGEYLPYTGANSSLTSSIIISLLPK